MQRSIKINDQVRILELSRAVEIKTSKDMIHFDKLDDGTWRMIYSGHLIPDIKKIKSFEIIRSEK